MGVIASGLCLLHCVATPLLFIAQTHITTTHETSPSWWGLLDYLFLIISFIAVYRSNQTTNKIWIGMALWISWSILAFVIINEKFELFTLSEFIAYIPALALIIFHLYNQKYCHCGGKGCIHIK